MRSVVRNGAPWGSKRKAGAYPGRTHTFPLSPSLLTNIFNNLYKYILQVLQMKFAIWTEIWIHLAIWTNTVSSLVLKKSSSLSELTLPGCHHRSHLTEHSNTFLPGASVPFLKKAFAETFPILQLPILQLYGTCYWSLFTLTKLSPLLDLDYLR